MSDGAYSEDVSLPAEDDFKEISFPEGYKELTWEDAYFLYLVGLKWGNSEFAENRKTSAKSVVSFFTINFFSVPLIIMWDDANMNISVTAVSEPTFEAWNEKIDACVININGKASLTIDKRINPEVLDLVIECLKDYGKLQGILTETGYPI